MIEAGAPDLRELLPKPHAPGPRERIATQEEIAKLLATAPPSMRCFILLCTQLALRFSEACKTAPKNWNRQDHTITLRTKGDKPRVLPLSPILEALFASAAAQPGEEDLPFIALLSGQRKLSRSGIRQQFKSLREKAGIPRDLNPHDLRRTTATALYRQTKDLRAVQQVLGHASIATTAQYLAPWADDEIKKILESNPATRWVQ
jgi:integrase